MFQVHPAGVLAAFAVAQCWALAALLFRTGASSGMAWRLALLLVIEGVTLGSSGAGVDHWFAAPDDVYAQYPWLYRIVLFVHTFGDCAMLALYPPFLAAALRTPLTRPFGDGRMRGVLGGVAAALFVAINLAENHVTLTLLYAALVLVFGFAFVAAAQTWRLASGATRTRALLFVLAFGFRDICWGFVYLSAIWQEWRLEFAQSELFETIHWAAYILGTLVAVPLIAYGILRTQLFDIDLRIRWTIKQSTLAAAVVALIFVISEGATQFLSAELGSVAGLLAAGVVIFFLAPLQRFADRVASFAMPNTENTPEYRAFRKLLVYRETFAEALQSGGVTNKERALLDRLRESLGIGAADALAIERDLQTPMTDEGQVVAPQNAKGAP